MKGLNLNYHDSELIPHESQGKHMMCDNLKIIHPAIRIEIVQLMHDY